MTQKGLIRRKRKQTTISSFFRNITLEITDWACDCITCLIRSQQKSLMNQNDHISELSGTRLTNRKDILNGPRRRLKLDYGYTSNSDSKADLIFINKKKSTPHPIDFVIPVDYKKKTVKEMNINRKDRDYFVLQWLVD